MKTIVTYLMPRFIASATAAMVMPSIMLLHILATSPEPAGPQYTHRDPMELSRCSAAVSVLSSPPTMNVRVPFSAPTTPAQKLRSRMTAITIHYYLLGMAAKHCLLRLQYLSAIPEGHLKTSSPIFVAVQGFMYLLYIYVFSIYYNSRKPIGY